MILEKSAIDGLLGEWMRRGPVLAPVLRDQMLAVAPIESADEVAQHARTHGFSFPVLKDPKNVQADVFAAKVTPEAFLFDAKGKLAYHGRIDDNREGNAIKSPDLTQALDAVLSGKPAPTPETKAFGCTIKRVQ